MHIFPPPGTPERRLWLRLSVKLLTAGAILWVGFVLLSTTGIRGGHSAAPALSVDVTGLKPGQVRSVEWNGRQVLILHRTPSMLSDLARPNPALADPSSEYSRQPAGLEGPDRSRRPEYLVLVGHGTDLGCPVEWVPPDTGTPVSPWYGGFTDHCRGSWYDLSGRVYADQAAPRNLPVPPYSLEGPNQIKLGGTSE